MIHNTSTSNIIKDVNMNGEANQVTIIYNHNETNRNIIMSTWNTMIIGGTPVDYAIINSLVHSHIFLEDDYEDKKYIDETKNDISALA